MLKLKELIGKIRFLFFYWLTWILLFEASRLLFLIYNFKDARNYPPVSLLQTFLYGLRMDASMATYLILLPCIFMMAGVFFTAFLSSKLFKIYTSILLLPILIIICCDLFAFNAWGNRLDSAPLKYLSSPKEAWASVSHLPIFWILFFFVLGYFVILKYFNRFISNQLPSTKINRNKFIQLLLLLIYTAVQIIPLRGGVQLAPINQSSVYFSTKNFLNLASINVPWNFMHSLNQRSGSGENPYLYLDTLVAQKITDSLLLQTAEQMDIIDLKKTPSPNIIVIVWESFIEKGTHISRNRIEITPGFNALKKEGIYFSNIYSSGDRTDKGIVAILSGYPAQPIASIIKTPRKSAKLPTLPSIYSNNKYNSSFYYGGELEFANMKSYLLGSGFQHFTSKDDFDEKDQNSKWGAHDNIVKDKILKDLSTTQSPFFVTWLTLSSHEPFETPVKTVINGKDDESLFLNSLHYTDSTIYNFIQQCKLQPWWSNTIVVITADHGHKLPRTGKQIDDFKIPLLWLGGALTKKGIEFPVTGSQTDIAATLLSQTGYDNKQFKWSKNLLGVNTKQWAYFSFSNAFGFVEPGKYFIFDNIGKIVIEKNGDLSADDINKGKAIEQESFADYLEK